VKIGFGTLCAVMLFLMSVTATFAALGEICEQATVTSVGAFNTGNSIKVRNDAGEPFTGWAAGAEIWVTLHPDNADAMLATALTAMSLGKQVTVVSPGNSYSNWGFATQVYLNN
jgi:hypothetical protein